MKTQGETLKALGEILQDAEFVKALVTHTDMIKRFAQIERVEDGFVTPVEELIHNLVLLHRPERLMDREMVTAEYETFLESWEMSEAAAIAGAQRHGAAVRKALGIVEAEEAA